MNDDFCAKDREARRVVQCAEARSHARIRSRDISPAAKDYRFVGRARFPGRFARRKGALSSWTNRDHLEASRMPFPVRYLRHVSERSLFSLSTGPRLLCSFCQFTVSRGSSRCAGSVLCRLNRTRLPRDCVRCSRGALKFSRHTFPPFLSRGMLLSLS